MTNETARQRLARIEAEVAKLAEQRAAIRAEVLQELRSEIQTFGFTASELLDTPRAARKSSTSKSAKPLKYRDPSTGAGWTGLGKKPNWLKAAEAAGKSKEDFKIQD